MPRRGFLLGKFMPLHQGHVFLCDVASRLVDELTVLVCTRDCEPIDGDLRAEWVRRSVRPNVRVVHMHRDVPQEPGDDPDFWDIWAALVKEHHPAPIDIVFGSEDYVIKLAEVVGASPFIVDRERRQVPVSATAIRNDPVAQWAHIPPVVRPYYQRRICLLGPESVGKTTLAEALGRHFQTLVVPEYGRDHDALYRKGMGWGPADFVAIARGHAALRTEISMRAGPICIEDTDLIQTMAWADYLLGGIPEQLVAQMSGWAPADHYLLLAPDVPWIDDGTRYEKDAAARFRFFDVLKALLQRHDLAFDVITGDDWASREAQAVASINAYCESSTGVQTRRNSLPGPSVVKTQF